MLRWNMHWWSYRCSVCNNCYVLEEAGGGERTSPILSLTLGWVPQLPLAAAVHSVTTPSRESALLFKGFLSSSWPSLNFTDYKSSFKVQICTCIPLMICCIQHILLLVGMTTTGIKVMDNNYHQAMKHCMGKLSGRTWPFGFIYRRGAPGRALGTGVPSLNLKLAWTVKLSAKYTQLCFLFFPNPRARCLCQLPHRESPHPEPSQ